VSSPKEDGLSYCGENVGDAVKVFNIGYGSDADGNGLMKIASVTGGQESMGTPQNIQQVYN
jgi:hypothetical protein